METEITPDLKSEKKFSQIYADVSLGLISFVESSFFPIITDPFLVAMTIAKPHKWRRYALIVSITSILGGLFGYFLGAVFFDVVGERLIAFYHAESLYETTVASMQSGAFVFTLIGALTPVPYKLVAIVGGVLHINILSFIIASILGRSVRFFLVTYISYKFGELALARFNKHLKIVTIAIVAGIALYLLMLFV